MKCYIFLVESKNFWIFTTILFRCVVCMLCAKKFHCHPFREFYQNNCLHYSSTRVTFWHKFCIVYHQKMVFVLWGKWQLEGTQNPKKNLLNVYTDFVLSFPLQGHVLSQKILFPIIFLHRPILTKQRVIYFTIFETFAFFFANYTK